MIENARSREQTDLQRAKRMGVAPSSSLRRHFLALARQTRHWFDGSGNGNVTRPVRTVGVTSMQAKAGTSTIAYNLAVAIGSLSRSRTLLVESNFGKPFLTRRLGQSRKPGLSDVLVEMAEMEASVTETPIVGLDLLGPGQVTDQVAMELPFDLLPATINRSFLDYRYAIFDLPLANHLTACYSIVPHLDGVILAAEANQIDHRRIGRFRQLMQGLGVPIIGLVINKQ